MADELTVTLKRPLAIAELPALVRAAWRELLGCDGGEVQLFPGTGEPFLGGREEDLSLARAGARVRVRVHGLPDHPCIPEDMAAWWAAVEPEAEGADARALALATAVALSRATGAPVVDAKARYFDGRERSAEAILAALAGAADDPEVALRTLAARLAQP